MGVTVRFRSGVATDAGLLRVRNEDRHWVDDDRGIFLVVDGVGGRAAGEKAAEVAVASIRDSLEAATGDAATRVREAIACANNAILGLARQREEWHGMACVLTLALVEDDRITIGHVGDSRLYLLWNGTIRKLTSDHSPVGELEDRAEISEEEAMLDPRRNEVFRDVGSAPHTAGDADFIETRQCLFKPDAAILLCSDGLTDLVTAAEISRIVERYDGDPARVACELVEAANDAGGRDNVTVIFVAGEEFVGRASQGMTEARARHAITRQRTSRPERPGPGARAWSGGRLFFLALGLALGLLIGLLSGAVLERFLRW
jgi:serine/threonine protein phosphatase PrpC